jgi:predicted O-methyltransferase YrrM
VIMAARKYKADATGVEFDPALVRQSTNLIRSLGLSASARIIDGDLLKQNYGSADVITVYLLPIANIRLKPILEKQLRKGSRMVSHNAAFPGWTPVRVEEIENDGAGASHRLYLYKR